MTGLTIGALLATRVFPKDMDTAHAHNKLAFYALLFSFFTVGATLFFSFFSHWVFKGSPRAWQIALLACAYLPGLICSGVFLAGVFGWKRNDISRIYAADLALAGLAVVATVIIMRVWQGPVSAFVPAFLGVLGALCLAGRGTLRAVSLASGAVLLVVVLVTPFTERPLLRLPAAFAANIDGEIMPITHERWNEHSRILVSGTEDSPFHFLYIDRDAMTLIPQLPMREEGQPADLPQWSKRDVLTFPYLVGREVNDVAVIGVGGGRDVLSALAGGATTVDGYELNSIFINLLHNEFYEYSGGLADWPEVNLIHSEGRVGITTSGKTYDVILATMIDTWAATANGGLVLSENSIYTVEAWERFLNQLTPHGMLCMTRWFMPREPAELQRLVVVAVEALARAGIENPADHVVVFAVADEQAIVDASQDASMVATLAVSKTPFTSDEIDRVRGLLLEAQIPHTLLYPAATDHAEIKPLIDPESRRQAIRNSPFNITATTDNNPYFFLLVRPFDLPRVFTSDSGWIREITYNGVRVLVIMTALSLLFAFTILAMTWRLPKAKMPRETSRLLSLYFVGIGFGYILVQLGLLQRLIVILGHPTYAFSVILFTMLIGSGIGSLISDRLPRKRFPLIWAGVVVVIILVLAIYPLFVMMDQIRSLTARMIICGTIPFSAGVVLGFCLPMGVRFAGHYGEYAVQRLWAINGAATVAGSCLAAFVGVAFGSRSVLIVSLLCYLLVAIVGNLLLKRERHSE